MRSQVRGGCLVACAMKRRTWPNLHARNRPRHPACWHAIHRRLSRYGRRLHPRCAQGHLLIWRMESKGLEPAGAVKSLLRACDASIGAILCFHGVYVDEPFAPAGLAAVKVTKKSRGGTEALRAWKSPLWTYCSQHATAHGTSLANRNVCITFSAGSGRQWPLPRCRL